MTTPVLNVPIRLTIPLAILKDGTAKTVHELTLGRPKSRHVKVLAKIVGAELLTALMGSGTDVGKSDDIDIGKLVADVAPLLFSADRLDAFESLLAELLSISVAEFGEMDPIDLGKVFVGFIDFFPALQSIASKSSALTSP